MCSFLLGYFCFWAHSVVRARKYKYILYFCIYLCTIHLYYKLLIHTGNAKPISVLQDSSNILPFCFCFFLLSWWSVWLPLSEIYFLMYWITHMSQSPNHPHAAPPLSPMLSSQWLVMTCCHSVIPVALLWSHPYMDHHYIFTCESNWFWK